MTDFSSYIEQLKEYTEQLKTRVAQLSGASQLELDYESLPPLAAEEVDEFAEILITEEGFEDLRIRGPVRDFYQAVNGFQWSWTLTGPQVIEGRANIVDMLELYSPEALAGQPLTPYGEYRLFDGLGSDCHVAALFERGQSEPRLYYRDEREVYFELSLGFSDYLEMLLQVRALLSWQVFFVKDPRFQLDVEQARAFISKLELLFPDVDSAPFRKRLEGAGA